MTPKFWIALALIAVGFAQSGCAPVAAAAVGAGAIVMADEAKEEEDGDDGLF